MKRTRMLAFLLAGSTALICLSDGAQAQQAVRYGGEGWWRIYHQTFRMEIVLCFATSFYKGHNVLLKFFSWHDKRESVSWSISLKNDKVESGSEKKRYEVSSL